MSLLRLLINKFMPPRGAMQFEVQRDFAGNLRTGTLWVKRVPRTVYSSACKCDPVFEVVDYSGLPRQHRRHIKKHMQENPDAKKHGFHVCTCLGRIIE